jgi:hypothetical protein
VLLLERSDDFEQREGLAGAGAARQEHVGTRHREAKGPLLTLVELITEC